VTVTADEALAQAAQAESEMAKGHYRGALHGIPFGAKDSFETRGIRTTGHSPAYEHHVPRENAAVIDQLCAGGTSPLVFGRLSLASRRARSACRHFYGGWFASRSRVS
jgi:Asp-tRNA(Asn)/Glu-tRNA(Gln) amidotransferase A subunit family amidase